MFHSVKHCYIHLHLASFIYTCISGDDVTRNVLFYYPILRRLSYSNELMGNHSLPADGYAVFESVKYPSQHVGIKPDGSAKPPNHTGTGDHGRFTPQVLNEVRGVRDVHLGVGSSSSVSSFAL